MRIIIVLLVVLLSSCQLTENRLLHSCDIELVEEFYQNGNPKRKGATFNNNREGYWVDL
jgi:hypothetical protein